MAKILRCSDLGAECQWEGRAETEEDLYKMACEHGTAEHGMTQMPPSLWEHAKTVIREE